MSEQNFRSQLASLSDGIFAVGMTLLAADITLPETQLSVPAALAALWPQVQGLLLSFAVAALYWINHHARLGQTAVVGRVSLRVNLLFLLGVVLLPIATRLLTRLPGSTGIVLYGGTLSLLALLNLLLWVLSNRALLPEHRHSLLAPGWAASAFVLGTAMAPWSAVAGSWIWYLAVAGSFLDRRLARRA